MCAKAPIVQICHKAFVHDCSLVNRVKMDTSEFFALCFACLYTPLFSRLVLSLVTTVISHVYVFLVCTLLGYWIIEA